VKGPIFQRVALLSALIASIALLPLVGFGTYAIQAISNYLTRESMEKLHRAVLDDADKITQAINAAHYDLPILSQLPSMRELMLARAGTNSNEIASSMRLVEHVFLTFSAHRKLYHQIRYIDEHGREIIRVDYDGTAPPRLIASEQLQDKRQRDYFSAAMTLGPGQVYASPLDLNQEHNRIEVPHRPVIRVAAPLFDDAGQRRGIVIINLLMGPLLETLQQKAAAARKVVYAVDQEGFYLLHPDPSKRWGGPRDLNTGERMYREFPGLDLQHLAQRVMATILDGQVIASQPIALSQSDSGPRLIIVETMPTAIALAAIADFRYLLLILLTGVGALTLTGAIMMGKRLTQPIMGMAQAAQRIQRGDLSTRVHVGGSMEIAVLGNAFNAMVDGLANAHSRIEQQLAELSALHQIGTVGYHLYSLNELLTQILDTLLHNLDIEAGEIFLLDEAHGEVILARHRGMHPEAFQQISRFKLGTGLPGLVALSGEPFLADNLPLEPRFLRTQVVEAGFHTFASVPLKSGAMVLGTLNLAALAPHRFTDENLPFLTTLGVTIGMALTNLHLYEGQRATTQQLTVKVEELERLQSRLIEAEWLRAIGQMAAGVAHDFNNALMGIMGQGQLMRHLLTQGPVQAALQGVGVGADLLTHLARQEQGVRDAAETIRKIQEATRPQRAEAFASVALDEVINEVLVMTQPRWKDQAEAAGIRITIHAWLDKTPPVLGQASELREALTNLLFNAFDAMPQGGSVTIATRRVSGPFVELTITDTGSGFRQACSPASLNHFLRRRGYAGAGLGSVWSMGLSSAMKVRSRFIARKDKEQLLCCAFRWLKRLLRSLH